MAVHQAEPSAAPELIVPPPPMSQHRLCLDRETFPLPGNAVLYAALAGLASCLPLVPIGLFSAGDQWQLVAVLAGLWAFLMAGGAALADRKSRTHRRSQRWALAMCLAGLPIDLAAIAVSVPGALHNLRYRSFPRVALALFPGALVAVCGVVSAILLGTLLAWALQRDGGAEKRATLAGVAAALVWVVGGVLSGVVGGIAGYGLGVGPGCEWILSAVTALLAGALVGNAVACRWLYAWRFGAIPGAER